MAKLSELLAQRAELEKQIADTQREEKSSAIAQVRSLMSEYGLSMADLGSRSGVAAPGGAPARKGSGNKVAAKYRDPVSGSTWSGRGLKPNWLKAALESGKSLQDFGV